MGGDKYDMEYQDYQERLRVWKENGMGHGEHFQFATFSSDVPATNRTPLFCASQSFEVQPLVHLLALHISCMQ
jgi:hypothetical protein